MKRLPLISFLLLSIVVLNAEEAVKAEDVNVYHQDDLILIHVNHDNCTLNSEVHDFGDLCLFANGQDAVAKNDSVFIYTLESGEPVMCDVDSFRAVLDQGINEAGNSTAEKFAECGKEIIEILKGVVQPNVSSEVMIKRLMDGLMKERAGTENDRGKEIKALVKLIKKIPLDQAKNIEIDDPLNLDFDNLEGNFTLPTNFFRLLMNGTEMGLGEWNETEEMSNGEGTQIGREKRFHGFDLGTFMPIWNWAVETSIGPLLREWLIPDSPLTKCMNYKDCFEHIHGKKRPQLRTGESSEQAVDRLSSYFVEQFRNRKTGMFERHEKTITDAINGIRKCVDNVLDIQCNTITEACAPIYTRIEETYTD